MTVVQYETYEADRRCRAMKRDGTACKGMAVPEWLFCSSHLDGVTGSGTNDAGKA